jgi:hypothetical protein
MPDPRKGKKVEPEEPEEPELGDEDGEPTMIDPLLQRRMAEQPLPAKKRAAPVPVGWDVHDLTNKEFWTRVCDIEAAQKKGLDEMLEALVRYGLKSEEEFRRARDRFLAYHGKDPDFRKAMEAARGFVDR